MNRDRRARAVQSLRAFDQWHGEHRTPIKTPTPGELDSGLLSGIVIQWDGRMGRVERQGAEYFMHRDHIDDGLERLRVGDAVQFIAFAGPKGAQARHVRVRRP